jgi:hypothetical protein
MSVVLRVLSVISFGLESEDWVKCESDWLVYNNSGSRLNSPTIKLDVKSRNISFVFVVIFLFESFFF